jgi:hypothetical protein
MPFKLEDENLGQPTTPNISGVSTGVDFNVPSGKGKTSPQRSGQYQNIQQYLSANQPQAGEMAGKVAGVVEKQAIEAEKAGQTLAAEAPKVGEFKPEEVLGQVSSGQTPTTTKEQYTQQRMTGGYTGPQDITGLGAYGEAQTKGETAKQTVQSAQTEAGQKNLLQQAYGRPGYGGTSGQNTLDQALFAQSTGGREAISQLGQKYSNLANVLGGYQTQAAEQLKASQEQAARNRAAFAPAEQAARASFLSPIEQRAAEANKQLEYQAAAEDLQDLRLDPQTMAMLGLSEGQRVYGANLGSFIGAPTAQANVQNIATEQERQRFNDLMNFIGGNTQELSLGQPTYKPVEVKQGDLQKELAARQTEFETKSADIGNIQSGLNNILNNGYDLAMLGLKPEQMQKLNTYEGLKDAYNSIKNQQGNSAFWNFLHGAPPPSEWGWDAGTQARYRASWSFVPAMEQKLSELQGLGAENIISSNVQPAGIKMKIKPGGA